MLFALLVLAFFLADVDAAFNWKEYAMGFAKNASRIYEENTGRSLRDDLAEKAKQLIQSPQGVKEEAISSVKQSLSRAGPNSMSKKVFSLFG
nr:unnamed protein product [Haemonchus contortus]